MSTDIYTMNLSESSDGMVPIDMGNRSNAFVPEAQSNTYAPEIKEEKNIHDYKDDMDSTPISDVLGGPQEGTSLEPPLMAIDPRAVQVAQANAMMPQVQAVAQKTEDPTRKMLSHRRLQVRPFASYASVLPLPQSVPPSHKARVIF